MQNDKVLSLLGLCMKAGRIKSGEFATTEAVKGYKAFLVIVASDASENTKKEFRNMSEFYETPYFEYATKEELGRALGKEERSSLAVLDEGFSKSLLKVLDNQA